MPRAKAKKTQEELFPHDGFPYRLEVVEPDGTKKGATRTAWFQCEAHLTKHVTRYRITEGQIDVKDGHVLDSNPFEVNPKRTRAKATTKKVAKTPAKPKAKTTTRKTTVAKASRSTTTKKAAKPAAKTKTTTTARKSTKKKVFSNLDTFFEG